MAKSEPAAEPQIGGRRDNAGRKADDGAKNLRQRSVNLNDQQNEFLKHLGGSLWLRGELNKRADKMGIDLMNDSRATARQIAGLKKK